MKLGVVAQLRILSAVTLLLSGIGKLCSQVATNYVFSEAAGTYSAIAGTVIHVAGWNDPVPVSVPIPFTFVFNGTGYTSCSVNGNGFVTFGATASVAATYTPISVATGYAGAISAMGLDLVSNASTVVYTTTGVSPNRVFVVQWNTCRRTADNVAGADWNFQIRLLETSNIIQIRYGACGAINATNTINAQVGLRGAANADFNNRNLASSISWAGSTTAGGVNTATVRSRNTALPPSGRTFIWSPVTGPTNSCDANGNVVIYSNYDGGVLNIVCDQNIPNLKIGVCTYEGTTINISGAFVGNVTAVYYAGYNASNAHCSGIINTTINGVAPGITSISIYPPATMSDPNGNPNIDCAYQCNTGNQGGCNTAGQVAHYFLTQFGGGTLRYQFTQYGCWTGPYAISAGGNCCFVNQVLPVELDYFTAECSESNTARIIWETSSETNNDYYTIERSMGGALFVPVAVIDGAGTTSQPSSYSWLDPDYPEGECYYRLKQTDFNGVSEYFPVIEFTSEQCISEDGELRGFPNPAGDHFVLQFYSKDEGTIDFVWNDVAGNIVDQETRLVTSGFNTITFSTSDFPQGGYVLSLHTNLPMKKDHILMIKK